MISPPRPYKSRLFNFLNRQRIVLGDRLAKTFRSAKVAAIWGTQILVYPAYLIAQGGRALVWKLEQKVAPIPLPETSQGDHLPVDTPVWKTLTSVKSLLDTIPGNYEIHAFAPPVLWTANLPAIAPATDTNRQTVTTSHTQHIRGIASTLNEHHLVLATVENQSLDLLTKKQQVHLEKTIRRELADYAYRQYLQRIKARQYLIPPSLTVNPNIAPPLRWFWQLMRWEQQGSIAQAIDLFQEAKIVPQWQEMSFLAGETQSAIAISPGTEIWLPPLPVADLVVELDEAIATLESKQNHLRDRLELWWQELESKDLSDGDRLTKMQHFLRAAMDYFFGIDDRKPALPADASSVEPDPWLVWEELYDRSREEFTPQVPQRKAIVEGEIQELYDRSQTLPLPSQPAQSSSTLPTSESMTAPSDPSPEQNTLTTVKTQLAQKPENQPELDDNWLEVDAKTTGYIEHPLEKVLKFVDAIVTWVEDAIVAVWKFLKRNF
ncbi:hypothetical protein [Spirulina sp. 06S082]|uniref:hypothetical protein n=1 Tax=Spirulina sp. 06S082 TaxID=3110248 RepID=UPI002B210C79|nr:hypothetical protein [Spirulina sp. 06S082]MEA5471518.1 hypothetical protein [Spirulina sp. 06S082]